MDEIRTVRALIARQDFYRAASAQVALLFGSISFIISFAVLVSPALFLATNFIGAWMCVFAAAAITAGALLRRDAKKRRERSRPERRRMVLTTISPPLLAGGAVTVAAIVSHIQPLPLAGFWMLFYGLVLLSTRLFAPRSIHLLGWGFLTTGMLLLMLLCLRRYDLLRIDHAAAGYWFMGSTFGLYHLAYGWLVKRVESETRDASKPSSGRPPAAAPPQLSREGDPIPRMPSGSE